MPTSQKFNFKKFVVKSVAVWLHEYKCALKYCGEPSDSVHVIDGNSDNEDLTNLLPLCGQHYRVYRQTFAPHKITRKTVTVLMLRRLTQFHQK